ncbi:ATP-binding cassette domain-containing protein [Patescibacteria group bacterium]|nr:ATP-binding cassette domain-containing protein [Patescibacteria group bacterium]MBU1682751.1 ATP-binding cassette domain-containing protein [Patescibacteria group bacterium]
MNIAISVTNLSKQFKINSPAKRALISRFSNIISGVGKRKKIQPLKHISFDVGKGESLGIIGKNGAGKTTLLKLIAGIYKKDSGEVKIDGKLLFLASLANGMKPNLSVRDNVFLVGSIFGLSNKKIKRIFNKIIEFASLENFTDCKVYQLSTGMKSRLSFSTAIHCVEEMNPNIMLLDEVLSGGGGDEEFKEKNSEKIKEIIHSGKTLVIVSHGLSTIEKLCKRTMWLHQGKIMKIGPSKEVIKAYLEFIKKIKAKKSK